MSSPIIQIENLSKQYRLGEVSSGTIAHDLNRWWSRVRRKEDPTLRVTAANDRAAQAAADEEYVWALEDINFDVEQGEVLGIIGRNGAGKSTLLKILSRVTAPTTGEIRIGGRIASLLEVGTGFHPELTGRENIFLNGAILGMSKAEIRSKLDEIVEFSGCSRYLDTPVKRYSSGMIVRLGFAVAAHLEPEILIVDEVLAVGDLEFQNKCIGKMKDVAGHGRTVIFVSHNMASIAALTNRCIIMDEGKVSFEGPTEEGIERYCEVNHAHGLIGPREAVVKDHVESIYVADERIQVKEVGLQAEAAATIPSSGALALELLLSASGPVSDVRIGYSVTHASGGSILNGYSAPFTVKHAGDLVCGFTIDQLNLAPGEYQVCLSLNQGGIHEPKYIYHIIFGAGAFKVEPRLVTGELIHEWPSAWGHIVHQSSELSVQEVPSS